MSGRSEKDKQKSMQDKYQVILSELLKQEENKYCVDCDAKGPRWASWNLGVFLCIRCAGIHRNLGVHLSRVKSVNLDSWTAEQMAVVQEIGNSKGRAIYEAHLPDNFRRPQTDSALEALIRAKYEHKKYMARDWNAIQTKLPTASSAQELSKKEKKRSKSSLGDQLPVHELHRSQGTARNASDSNLFPSRAVSRAEPPVATSDSRAKENSVQLPSRTKPADILPAIELISLASPDNNVDANEFGSFHQAPESKPTAANAIPSDVATSSDLADLDFFGGVAVQANNDSAVTTATAGSTGQASKDDIMALFGPSSNANMYGVPGGIYMPRQQAMCQPGGGQQAPAMGYQVMPNNMQMMQSMVAAPQGMNGAGGQMPVAAPPSYGLYQGYAPAQMQQPGVTGNGAVWCPHPGAPQQPQQQQMMVGHTLSNVLWQ